jgi:hypothetical protein
MDLVPSEEALTPVAKVMTLAPEGTLTAAEEASRPFLAGGFINYRREGGRNKKE